MNTSEAARQVVAALSGGEPVAEVVVIASANADVSVGTRMLVWDGRGEGSLGDPRLDQLAVQAGRAALAARRPSTSRIDSPGGEVELFVEPHHPPDELLIVGAGHIARPLCRIGAMLGFKVTILDDRPGFATRERFPEADRLVNADFSDPFREVALGGGTHLVLVTRGHKYDYEALRDVLRRDVELAYVGMVGSQRRVRAAFEQLVKEHIPRARLERVFSPIGLDIGAETPEEIAISIAGELIRLRRGGTGASLRDSARVMDRWFKDGG